MRTSLAVGVPFLVAVAWAPVVSAAAVYALLLVCLVLAAVHRMALPLVFGVLGLLVANSVPVGPLLRGPVAVQGRVVAAPVGRMADVEVWACAEGAEPFLPCTGRVRVAFDQPPTPGSRWVVRGSAGPPRSRSLGGPDPAAALARSRIRAVVFAHRAVELDGVPPMNPAVEGALGLLASLATGDRRGVDAETWRILRQTGTAHLLAISGFHVGVVAAVFGGVAAFGIRRAGGLVAGGLPPALAWWVGGLAAIGYAVSAGAPISAQRAAGMVVLAALARSWRRQIAPWRLLLTVAVGVLAVDPAALVSPGFQLSFGAVVGLLRFGGPIQAALRLPGWLGWLRTGLSASTAATLGTLPAASWWFQAFAPSSPLANLIAIPWVTFGVAPFAAVWAYAPEPIAGWAGFVGSTSVMAWLAVLDRLATAPWTPAVDASGALFLCLIVVRTRPSWVVAVLVVGLGLRPRPVGVMEVWFLDVGQGDAAVVHFPDGRTWLVDGGRRDDVVSTLRRRGVRRLDVVVASHGDADHAGGLPAVVCELNVGELWIGRYEGHDVLLEASDACGVPVVVHGLAEDASSNAASLVVRATSPHGDVLFTGDLDAAGEGAVTQPATVLKVPHHGSDTSSSAHLVRTVDPSLAIISVGDNRYGHPHASVLARYAVAGVPILRTDRSSSIRVRLESTGPVYGAMGPVTWFSRALRAPKKNTATAKTASPREMPWL